VGLSVAAPATSAAGCAWTTAKAPNPGEQDTRFYSVDGVANDQWIVGQAKDKGARPKALTLHNSGAGWKVVKAPSIKRRDNALLGVEYVGASDVWAVGQAASARSGGKSLVEHWDGTSWTKVPIPASGKSFDALYSIDATPPGDLPIDALTPRQLWAVGFSNGSVENDVQALIAHYDGSSWELQSGPAISGRHGLTSVLVLAPDDVWAVGFVGAGENSQPLAMHFDGSVWESVSTPGAALGSSLVSITGDSANDLWAVGNQGTGIPLVMHWDGTVWSPMSYVPDGSGAEALTSIAMDETGGLWAAGFSQRASGIKTLIKTMTGESWSTERSPSPTWLNLLVDITPVPGGPVWAVGFQFGKPPDTRPVLPPSKGLLLRCG
jgi:hypothetical protein